MQIDFTMMLVQILDSNRNSYLHHLATIAFQLGNMFQLIALCLEIKQQNLFRLPLDDCSDHKKGEDASEITSSIQPYPLNHLKNILKNTGMDTQVNLSSLEKRM